MLTRRDFLIRTTLTIGGNGLIARTPAAARVGTDLRAAFEALERQS